MTTRKILFLILICFIGFQACKNSSDKSSETSIDPELLKKDTIHINLKADDKMKFDKKELVVGENQIVVLKLQHTGKMSVETMGHNFVLLDEGVSASRFAQRAAQARATDYIPESNRIIAHTDLIGGGESTEITFKAPAKGSYDFLCTFPGHFASMNGKFLVK